MPNPKNYYRPKSIEGAIERAAHPGSIALAGGAMMLGGTLLAYETIVDLQNLVELKKIEQGENSLTIGGSVNLQQVVESDIVPDVLKRSITRTIAPNIRNGASIGESLTVPDPPPELLAALVVFGAKVEHAGNLDSAPESHFWEQPIEEFEQYLHLHGHPYQGVIKAVHIPLPDEQTVFGTAHVARTPADIAIVNAAVRVSADDDGNVKEAVAALGGASELPVIQLKMDTLVGNPLDEVHIANAVKSVRVKPVADYQGSTQYRREMVYVVLRRALAECM